MVSKEKERLKKIQTDLRTKRELERHKRKLEEAQMIHAKVMNVANGYADPYVKEKEPGRNEECYCGSGKKYKKCCLV